MRCTFPQDPIIRGNFYSILKYYRKRCKSERSKFKANLVESLNRLHKAKPNEYWRLVNEISEKNSKGEPLDPSEFFEHFKNLNAIETPLTDDRMAVLQQLRELENKQVFNELDFKITGHEILKSVQSLKNNKAAGLDSITNEMIKSGISTLLHLLTKFFNNLICLGKYPSSWNTGKIIPLHKKGDRSDPGNYRGITISSCLGKLFNSILNSRLQKFLVSNNILQDEQIGFRKDHRTSDHMLILKTLMDFYRKRKKQLYLSFIDFRKAFDTVWHVGLIYKLVNIGVSSNFLKLIKAMYSQVSLAVQCNANGLTPSFPSLIGVRQGDNLSPTLFSIYVNDIPELFDDNCHPAKFGSMTIPCLLFADDLLIFSESKGGMQKALNKLQDYCNLLALSINTSKTKSMCILTDADNDQQLKIGKSIVEMVKSFRYLGIDFSADGNTLHTKRELYKRGLKVYFQLIKSFNPLPKASIMLHLFDHMIKPVLLYSCEIWSPVNLSPRPSNPATDPREQFHKDLKHQCPIAAKFLAKDDPIEKLHLKLCKYIAGVHSKTTTMGVYGDLGRLPLYVDQITQSVKYYYRLISPNSNKLLTEFYNNMESMGLPQQKNGLSSFANEILRRSKLHLPHSSKAMAGFAYKLKTYLRHEFTSYWASLINTDFTKTKARGGNKLRTYRMFKRAFKQELYLELPNRDHMKALAKFRLSAHRLNIETGRFNGRNQYVPPEGRICNMCSQNAIEDEIHFAISCPAYVDLREKLFTQIRPLNQHFSSYNDEQKFIWLLSAESPNIIALLALFVYESFQRRV